MRPAYSVILFSTLSGAGYGLLAVVAVLLALGGEPPTPLLLLGTGLLMVTTGLIASTFHLGRRERAWRAFSQWRTSWLSREAVMAMVTYAAVAPVIWKILVGTMEDMAARIAAVAMAVACLATVYCTAMIYASLRPVRQWRHWTVPAAYLLFALASGTLLLNPFLAAGGFELRSATAPAVAALVLAWVVRELNWRIVVARPGDLTTADATGLARFGTVRTLDPPHTETNYLLHEFGFRVARRHAIRLRRLARLLGWAIPIVLVLMASALALPQPLEVLTLAAAAGSALVGILIERWLFFAEATHTVALYYGAPSA
ncbi:MAG: dimethyl sulfoxide reductase anchor subunit family protein [Geminicoccaceae bacterium]